jgi:hypothetical protein
MKFMEILAAKEWFDVLNILEKEKGVAIIPSGGGIMHQRPLIEFKRWQR